MKEDCNNSMCMDMEGLVSLFYKEDINVDHVLSCVNHMVKDGYDKTYIYRCLVENYFSDKSISYKILAVIDEIKPDKFYVYALTLDSEIVYIGSTTRLYDRIKCHTDGKNFNGFLVQELDNNTDMLSLEMMLIDKYRPDLNIALNLKLARSCSVEENLTDIKSYTPDIASYVNFRAIGMDVSPLKNYLYLKTLTM